MKKEFEKLQSMANDFREFHAKFDILIKKKYGFHYSDKDLDEIIDALDYGQGTISFERFEAIMKNPEIVFNKNE